MDPDAPPPSSPSPPTDAGAPGPRPADGADELEVPRVPDGARRHLVGVLRVVALVALLFLGLSTWDALDVRRSLVGHWTRGPDGTFVEHPDPGDGPRVARNRTELAARRIGRTLRQDQDELQAFASTAWARHGEYATAPVDPEGEPSPEVRDRLLSALEALARGGRFRYGASLTFDPAAPDGERVAASVHRTPEGTRATAAREAATDTEGERFRRSAEALASPQGPTWSEPYRSTGEVWLVTLSVPVPAAPGIGAVASIDYALEDLARLALAPDLGMGGFPALLSGSDEPRYLYHPRSEAGDPPRSLEEVRAGDPDLPRLRAAARQGGQDLLLHRSVSTGELSWLAIEPILWTQNGRREGPGWSLQNTFVQRDLLGSLPVDPEATPGGLLLGGYRALLQWAFGGDPRALDSLRRALIRAVLAVVALLLALAALRVLSAPPTPGRLRASSLAVAVTSLVGLSAIYEIADHYTSSALVDAVGTEEEDPDAPGPDRTHVPLGAFVDALRLDEGAVLQISGRLWLRYPPGADPGLRIEPELPGAREFDIRQLHCAQIAPGTRPGPCADEPSPSAEIQLTYAFEAEIAQRLDPAGYPLDRALLSLHVRHPDPGVVLLPDLAAYDVAVASERPGLSEDLSLHGWLLVGSYFRRLVPERGVGGGLEQRGPAEYELLIELKRNRVGAFVYGLVPILVVLLLLYATVTVMRPRRHEDEPEPPISTGETLGMTGALALVIVFAHIDLRDRILAEGLVHLEGYYLVTYAAVLWVTLLAVLFSRPRRWMTAAERSLGESHVVSRLAFWPTLGILLLVLGAAWFY